MRKSNAVHHREHRGHGVRKELGKKAASEKIEEVFVPSTGFSVLSVSSVVKPLPAATSKERKMARNKLRVLFFWRASHGVAVKTPRRLTWMRGYVEFDN
jgi:hypothetical protein